MENLTQNNHESLNTITHEQTKNEQGLNNEYIMEIVKDLSDLIERGSRLSSNLLSGSKENLFDQIQEIGGQVHEVSLKMTNKTPSENAMLAINATQNYVREHPIQAVGIAVGAGFLLSTLFKNKHSENIQSKE